MKAPLCLLLLLSWSTATVYAKCLPSLFPATDTMRAATVVNRAKAAYAQLPVYLDSGKVIQSFYNTVHPGKTAKVFKTAYTRRGMFNFEYYDVGRSNSLYTINRSSNVVRSWWGITDKISAAATINLALMSATGVSAGTSFLIPRLLLTKDFKQNVFTSLTSLAIAGNEKVGRVDCYKISGLQAASSNPVNFWIGKKDFLIRKIEMNLKISPENNVPMIRRIDSLAEITHKKDTAWLKTAALRKAATARRNAIMDLAQSMKDFNVKSSYLFYPYRLHKMNPDLLKFRPNREVAL